MPSRRLRRLLFTLLTLSVALVPAALGQGDPGLPDDPTAVPLDGGLTLLGAAGAAYAVRRLRGRSRGGAPRR